MILSPAVVDAFIQKKCAKALHSFSQTVQQRLTRAITSSKPLQVPQALATFSTTGHGRKSSQRNTHSRSRPHEQPAPRKLAPKIYTMKDFFQSTTLGQFLKDKSIKTNYDFQKKAIYKIISKIDHPYLEKGDCFYLDNFHKDHIEVFNSRGKCKAVLNLDGSLNAQKSANAIESNRCLYN